MLIAIALDTEGNISQHFRATAAFAICEPAHGGMQLVETRTAAPHEHHDEHVHHDHQEVTALLADCVALICGGMGGRAAQDLLRHGIDPVVTLDCTLTPLDAALRFTSGRLDRGTIHACCCEH